MHGSAWGPKPSARSAACRPPHVSVPEHPASLFVRPSMFTRVRRGPGRPRPLLVCAPPAQGLRPPFFPRAFDSLPPCGDGMAHAMLGRPRPSCPDERLPRHGPLSPHLALCARARRHRHALMPAAAHARHETPRTARPRSRAHGGAPTWRRAPRRCVCEASPAILSRCPTPAAAKPSSGRALTQPPQGPQPAAPRGPRASISSYLQRSSATATRRDTNPHRRSPPGLRAACGLPAVRCCGHGSCRAPHEQPLCEERPSATCTRALYACVGAPAGLRGAPPQPFARAPCAALSVLHHTLARRMHAHVFPPGPRPLLARSVPGPPLLFPARGAVDVRKWPPPCL